MDYEIRHLDWNDVALEGVPFDCMDIMQYFNDALRKNSFPLVPRTNPITLSEIKIFWAGGKDKNIAIVACSPDPDYLKVIGSGTLFVDEKERTGYYNLTVNPDFANQGVGESITKRVIGEAGRIGVTINIMTSVHNYAVRRLMSKLGYWPINYIENDLTYEGRIAPPENSQLPPFATLHYAIRPR